LARLEDGRPNLAQNSLTGDEVSGKAEPAGLNVLDDLGDELRPPLPDTVDELRGVIRRIFMDDQVERSKSTVRLAREHCPDVPK
jgi:hypothetical protein